MASGRRRPTAAASEREWRERFLPWLAAGVVVLLLLAALARRACALAWRGLRRVPVLVARVEERAVPAISAAGVTVASGFGWAVDVLARGLAALARRIPPTLARVERVAVPALARGARGVAVTCGRGVDALAALLAPLGPRLAAHGPRAGKVVTRIGVLGIAAVAAVGLLLHPLLLFASTAVTLDEQAPEAASFPPLDERSTVYAADGSTLAILHGEIDRRVVSLDQVPEHVRHAVLVAEDRRFNEHGGYDVEGILRAALENVRAGRVVQGGSTITQQLAKQNYVGDRRALTRKVSELVYAVALERTFDKGELLERYLNQVYFGSGAYGIAAAAERLFAVPPEELTVAQAALLAGLIRSPGALDPRENPGGAQRRRDAVLAAMAEGGFLTAEEARAAQAQPVELAGPRPPRPTEPHIVEAVKQEFLSDPAFGDTREERVERLFAGGLQIHTTVDPAMQALAAEVVQAAVSQLAGPTAAVAVVEPVSGKVRSLYSGLDFSAEQFNLATQGRRQPGSAFKPFVLAAALEEFGAVGGLRGSQATFTVPGSAEPWEVDNYEGATYDTLDGHDALVRSVNTAFAELMLRVGLDPVERVLADMGIDVEAALGPPQSRGPAIALGGLTHGVSPLEMASAYATFANNGIAVRPYLIERLTDGDGNEIFTREPSARQALDADVNAEMVDALQDVVQRGTGRRARLAGWEPIGKTGTTQDSADAWFIGAVPGLSVAVWVGHPDGQTPVSGLTGGSVPAPIWQAFMERVVHGAEPVAFPESLADRKG